MVMWLVLSRDAYRGGDPGISLLNFCSYITDDTCVLQMYMYIILPGVFFTIILNCRLLPSICKHAPQPLLYTYGGWTAKLFSTLKKPTVVLTYVPHQ